MSAPTLGRVNGSQQSEAIFSEWQLNSDLNASFQYSPPKPDSDPWTVLLEPMMRKDQEQCEVWKDEVENLLIFAGLFSAVVTAFVVESYKTLQPDPQDTIILLLSQISASLDNNSAPLPAPDFDPDPANIRINSLWLVSLVLSLTTVLVGIISLQWLREHQSYPDLTPRESFGIFRMREEGLDRWYVRKVFTALPLLLQAALILFLAGMVEFSLTFGNKVAIPTVVAICLTLLFLLVTTTLPTFQGLKLFFPIFYSKVPLVVPSQCPYKSPQSRAFRTLSRFPFRIFYYLHRHFAYHLKSIYNYILRPFGMHTMAEKPEVHHIISLVSKIWGYKSWADFDLGWLDLREAYGHGTTDRGKGLGQHLESYPRKFPVYDLTLGLREVAEENIARGKEDYLSAAYHCLLELSQLSVDRVSRLRYTGHDIDDAERHHRYFQELLRYGAEDTSPLLSEYLDFKLERPIYFSSIDSLSAVLHHENIVLFLTDALQCAPHDSFLQLQMLREEIKIRLTRWIFQHNEVARQALKEWRSPPLSISIRLFDISRFVHLGRTTKDYVERGHELYWQYIRIAHDFFKYAGNNSQADWTADLHVNNHVPLLMAEAASITRFFLDFFSSQQSFYSTDAAFASLITTIAERFEDALDSVSESDVNLDLLFYSSVLFLRPLSIIQSDITPRLRHIYQELQRVLPLLSQYKTAILDVKGRDAFLERRFAGEDDSITRFTDEWWEFLYKSLPLDDITPSFPSPYYYFASVGGDEIPQFIQELPSHLLESFIHRSPDSTDMDGFPFGTFSEPSGDESRTALGSPSSIPIPRFEFSYFPNAQVEDESPEPFANPDADTLV